MSGQVHAFLAGVRVPGQGSAPLCLGGARCSARARAALHVGARCTAGGGRVALQGGARWSAGVCATLLGGGRYSAGVRCALQGGARCSAGARTGLQGGTLLCCGVAHKGWSSAWRFWRRPEAAAAASERDPVAPAASWFAQRGASGGSVSCPYVIRTGDRAVQTCGRFHNQHRFFSRLDDAWCTKFGDEAERPRWAEVLRSGVVIFDLDYDAILAAMFALSVSAEGDCYLCVPRDPGIEAAALGASESFLPGTAPAEALHTFTLDSGASRYFFRDSTTLTPLSAPIPIRLADPYGGPVLARSSTVLPCPAVLSGLLSSLHLPSFSTNLVSTAALQDEMVTTTTHGVQHVSICMSTWTGRHPATFTRWPGSSLYTLATEPPRVAASAQVSASVQVALPCSCRLLSHQGQSVSCSASGSIRTFLFCVCTLTEVVSSPPRWGDKSDSQALRWGAGGAEPAGVEPGGTTSGGAESRGTASSEGPAGAPPRLSPRPEPLSPQQLCEWFSQCTRLQSGATGAGDSTTGDSGTGGAGVSAGAGGTRGAAAAGLGGARTGGTGAAGTGGVGGAGAGDPTEPGAVGAGGARAVGAGAGGTGAGAGGAGAEGAGAVDPRDEGTGTGGAGAGGAGAIDVGARGARGNVRPRSYFVPLLQQVLGVPSSTGITPPLLCPPPDESQLPPAVCEPASCPASPICTGRRDPSPHPPPVPGTHAMTIHPSSVPLRVPLSPPPESSFPAVPDPESDHARAASPTVSRLLATVVTYPSFESTAASALVAQLVDFALACRLDYGTSLVAESKSASPLSVGGECPLGIDVLEDRQEDFECLAAAVPRFASMLLAPDGDPDAPDIPTPRSYAEAITGPYSSQWQAAMDAEMASRKSTGTYVDAVPPSRAKIVDGMWIFRVKRPPGSPLAFKARYVARGFTFLQSSLPEEIWLRRPPGFTGLFPAGTQWSLRRPVYDLRQAPHEWHETLRTTLADLGFTPIADPSLLLRINTSLPPFYVLVYVDDLVFVTADTEALTLVKSELQKRHTCTDLGELHSFLGLQITQDRARRTITLTQSHMVHQVLQCFSFEFSSPQPTPLSTGHSLSAPPLDKSVESSGSYPELVGCLVYLMTCTRPDLAYPLSLLARYVAPGRHRKVHWDVAKRVLRYLCSTSGMGLVLGGRGLVVLTGHADASWADNSATQRSSQGFTFSLGSGSDSRRSTRSSSDLSSSCEAEIYAGAMASQELRWLTYLLTDLGEQPRLPPVLFGDNKAMIALCQEHRLEHRTKHIAL
ncbi:unnamed protein product [Closterium sp. NIES-54]